jgi:hypothetical protein
MPEFVLTKTGWIDKATNKMASFLPEHAITYTGRRVSFQALKDMAQECLRRRVWALKDYADIMLWLQSYENGGAMPGSQLFLSPYGGGMVPFTVLLEDMCLASDYWAAWNPVYQDWGDDLIKASEIFEWIDDAKENITIEDPEDVDHIKFLMGDDLMIEEIIPEMETFSNEI